MADSDLSYFSTKLSIYILLGSIGLVVFGVLPWIALKYVGYAGWIYVILSAVIFLLQDHA
jgi:hypothetical protein